jgi:hypothetical protein
MTSYFKAPRFLACFVALLAFVSTSFAYGKEQQCSIGEVSTVEHRDGVTVRTVSFVEVAPATWSQPDPDAKPFVPSNKRVTAHVYIPDSAEPAPAILFSHSGIHTYQGTTSLLPFAFAMARAGAASIVMDRAIQWEPYDEAANTDTSVMDCASRWLLSEVKIDISHIATAGNYHWPQGMTGPPFRALRGSAGFAIMASAEIANNKALRSVKGQMRIAHGLLSFLKLPDVNPEWLKVETVPDEQQVAAN